MSGWLKGVIVASITPFREDLSIDTDAVRWIFQKFVDAGINGAFVSGTTGEWPMLKPEERRKLAEIIVDAVGGKLKILLGVSGLTLDEALGNLHVVRELEVDGFVSTPPLYFKPSNNKLKEFYLKLAEESNKPIIIYTIPSRVGYNVPVEVVAELAQEHSLIAGIKATVADLHYLQELAVEVKSIRPDFAVLAGYGEYLLDSLIVGGDGAVDALTNIVPKLTAAIYNAWSEGRLDEALKLHRALARLASIMRDMDPIQSVIKSLLTTLGAPLKPLVRPSLAPANPKEISTLLMLLCTAYRDYLVISDRCG